MKLFRTILFTTVIMVGTVIYPTIAHSGIFSFLAPSEEARAGKMVAYYSENYPPEVFTKEDVNRLAYSCLHYASDPEDRFLKIIELCNKYRGLGSAWHGYDIQTFEFTWSNEAENIHSSFLASQDIAGARFMERLKHSKKASSE